VRNLLKAARVAQHPAAQPQPDVARSSPRQRVFRSNQLPSSHAARLEVRIVRATFLLGRYLAATTGTASSFADAAMAPHQSAAARHLPKVARRPQRSAARNPRQSSAARLEVRILPTFLLSDCLAATAAQARPWPIDPVRERSWAMRTGGGSQMRISAKGWRSAKKKLRRTPAVNSQYL